MRHPKPSLDAGFPCDALAVSDRLHARARAMIRAFELGRCMPELFDALATDLARFQATHVAGYGRLCEVRGVVPDLLTRACDAPAVPTDAFKFASVFAFPAAAAAVAFRTSGTTIGARGVHAMRETATYDAAALAFGRAMLLEDLAPPVPVLVLGPSALEAPDSSLAHMCALFARTFGDGRSRHESFIRAGALDLDGLRKGVAALDRDRPAVMLATSFALLHTLDAMGGDGMPLPPGSRVMLTGGFKGRSREVSPAELRTALARAFAVEEGAVIGEYGMTELSSQFWQRVRVGQPALAGRRAYAEPPWARVVPVDPTTLAPVAEGEAGIARIEDLANIDSAWAIVTQDWVRRVENGFELLGRQAGAPPRGCSIAVDEMLSAPR